MSAGFLIAFGLAGALVAYTYVGYPTLLKLMAAFSSRRAAGPASAGPRPAAEWPSITIVVPAYNEAASLAETLEALLRLDYPAERRRILVLSDASTDATDAIARGFADRGVELHRQPARAGKTAAENAVRNALHGEIIVNTDATIRIPPGALKPLLAAFADPSVGVASGRDVSVTRGTERANRGESRYVGYEMWVRALETRAYGIVGASGCFYGIRAALHREFLPDALSRDFAAALIAREHGLRAVSVPDAVCYVPRTASLRHEYRRKVRTMARGISTLRFKRHLLNPFRYGAFAWMLFSHKVCRWLVPWAVALALAAAALAAATLPLARWALGAAVGVLALAALGFAWPERRPLPALVSLASYFVAGNLAALEAGVRALRGERNRIWEPTRRTVAL